MKNAGPMLDRPRPERLREFYRRLAALPPSTTAEEALAQIAAILTAVEDELTLIPNVPENWQSDGRMYPPQADARRAVPDHPEVSRYRSRGHNTFIRENDAIEIQAVVGGQIEFEKPGADGKKVWEP